MDDPQIDLKVSELLTEKDRLRARTKNVNRQLVSLRRCKERGHTNIKTSSNEDGTKTYHCRYCDMTLDHKPDWMEE